MCSYYVLKTAALSLNRNSFLSPDRIFFIAPLRQAIVREEKRYITTFLSQKFVMSLKKREFELWPVAKLNKKVSIS